MSELTVEQAHNLDLHPKEPIWEVRDIFKSFPGVQALDDVSISVYPGEVHALLGENGSGKSTLAKCIAGVHLPEKGEILYKGQVQNFRQPMDARAGGGGTIYQDFFLVPS